MHLNHLSQGSSPPWFYPSIALHHYCSFPSFPCGPLPNSSCTHFPLCHKFDTNLYSSKNSHAFQVLVLFMAFSSMFFNTPLIANVHHCLHLLPLSKRHLSELQKCIQILFIRNSHLSSFLKLCLSHRWGALQSQTQQTVQSTSWFNSYRKEIVL